MNKNYTVTDKARKQRRQAARKHGAYAIRQRGLAAMDPEQRSLFIELQEQITSHDGVIDALIEQTAQALVITQFAAQHVSEQAQKGIPLDEIKLLKMLPAFWNSASRMLAQLLAVLPNEPDDSGVLELLNKYKEGGQDASDL